MERRIHASVERSAYARHKAQRIRDLSSEDSRGLPFAGSLVLGEYRSGASIGCTAETSASAAGRVRYDEFLDQWQARGVVAGFGAGRYSDRERWRGSGTWRKYEFGEGCTKNTCARAQTSHHQAWRVWGVDVQ